MYSNNLICNILEYINTFKFTKITIDDLEHKFYFNRYYIMKLFKKELGITIFEYINILRVNSSLIELNNSNDLLIKVAINNGFYSLEYFSEIFKKEIGLSPQKYRKFINNKFEHDDSINMVTSNLIRIQDVIYCANRYIQHRKRDTLPVKTLSFFK